jgi:hypothetical protein
MKRERQLFWYITNEHRVSFTELLSGRFWLTVFLGKSVRIYQTFVFNYFEISGVKLKFQGVKRDRGVGKEIFVV